MTVLIANVRIRDMLWSFRKWVDNNLKKHFKY
jgi:hypothetical protein